MKGTVERTNWVGGRNWTAEKALREARLIIEGKNDMTSKVLREGV